MLSVQELRKKLGAKADGLTDEIIEKMRDELYVHANLIFDDWRKSHHPTNREKTSEPLLDEKLV